MRKIVSFMHVSLDGFVADAKGNIDWITVGDEMFDYAAQRTNESDTALYGRVTFEMMENYWPTAADKPNATKHDIEHSEWYNRVEKVVLSRLLRNQKLPNTIIISDNVEENIHAIKNQAGKEIIIFGSPSVVHLLTQVDLIDDFWLFINPVLLGSGIPLFSNIKEMKKLKLISCDSFSSGVVCLHYEKN
ncbi:MAG: dihydrofolate reductase family protein [Chitinophagaceae bacterium]